MGMALNKVEEREEREEEDDSVAGRLRRELERRGEACGMYSSEESGGSEGWSEEE